MTVLKIIQVIEDVGGKISLKDGGLRLVATKGAVTPEMLATVKSHKTEIINFIARQVDVVQEKQEPAPIVDGLHSCLLCGGHLFNEGIRGGYFCVECQGLPEGATVARVVRGVTPRKRNGCN